MIEYFNEDANKQLDEIFEQEERSKLAEEAIKKLPIIGRYDPEKDCVVLPASEYDPEDDIWDEVYKELYPNEKI